MDPPVKSMPRLKPRAIIENTETAMNSAETEKNIRL
jgi:hypothetical protein